MTADDDLPRRLERGPVPLREAITIFANDRFTADRFTHLRMKALIDTSPTPPDLLVADRLTRLQSKVLFQPNLTPDEVIELRGCVAFLCKDLRECLVAGELVGSGFVDGDPRHPVEMPASWWAEAVLDPENNTARANGVLVRGVTVARTILPPAATQPAAARSSRRVIRAVRQEDLIKALEVWQRNKLGDDCSDRSRLGTGADAQEFLRPKGPQAVPSRNAVREAYAMLPDNLKVRRGERPAK